MPRTGSIPPNLRKVNNQRYSRKYRERNREIVNRKARAYYTAHREQILAARARQRIKKNAQAKLYYQAKKKADPLKWFRDLKAARLRREFNLDLDTYYEMVKEQHGLCAICQRPNKGGRELSVDHDHKTGKIRGLLCLTCNSGLGQFEDSLEYLSAAIYYLEQTNG